MGRTLPTYTRLLDEHRAFLTQFRHALRKEDREALDEVLDAARLHASAGTYAAHPDPFQALVLSVLIEQRHQIKRLQHATGVKTPLAQTLLANPETRA